jgi:hypothetical protein
MAVSNAEAKSNLDNTSYVPVMSILNRFKRCYANIPFRDRNHAELRGFWS